MAIKLSQFLVGLGVGTLWTLLFVIAITWAFLDE